MATITFGSGLSFSGAATVFTKARWEDDWTEQPSMTVERVTWSLWPSMPVAEVSYKYGKVLYPGDTTYTTVTKSDFLGYFIKLEIEAEDGDLLWVGFIDEEADYQGGIDSTVSFGRQLLTCYSLSQVLGYQRMTQSFWWDAAATAVRSSGSAIAFNAGGKPNRTSTKPSGQPSHLFDPDELLAAFWTSRDITEYLVAHHMPKDSDGVLAIEWEIENLTLLPNWDKPSIETDRSTVLQILNTVIDRRFFLSAWDGYVDDAGDQTATINLVSLAVTDVDLGSSRTIPAATTQHDVVLWSDPATTATVQTSASGMYHQVIARGARRTATCSFNVGDGLYKSWSDTAADVYNAAASTLPSYAVLGSYQRHRMNAIAREDPLLQHVYRILELRHTDDFADDLFSELVFRDDATPPNKHHAFFGMIEIEPTLPFYHGADYSDDAIENIASLTITQKTLRLPLVMIERPDFGGDPIYSAVGQIGQKWLINGANDDAWFSIDVSLPERKRGLILDVNGAPQHVIAGTQFVKLDDDVDPASLWDIATTHATVTLRDDRYIEVSEPEDPDVEVDVLRKLVIDLGDGWRRDYVVPGTIVAVDSDGTFKRSEGGFVRDDSAELRSIAKSAAAWYTRQRAKLLLVSSRVSAVLRVGDLVKKINPTTGQEATINTTISEISLVLGESPSQAQAARYSVATSNAELDPLIFLPPEPKV